MKRGVVSEQGIVALAKKMTKLDTKTVTLTVSIPKTKVIKQSVQQASPLRTTQPPSPQKPLPNQQIS